MISTCTVSWVSLLFLKGFFPFQQKIFIYIYIFTCNPKWSLFDWKRPSFRGLKPQSRGQTGSRYIMYTFVFNKWSCIELHSWTQTLGLNGIFCTPDHDEPWRKWAKMFLTWRCDRLQRGILFSSRKMKFNASSGLLFFFFCWSKYYT